MKIFKMNEYDWCAGEEFEGVKNFYMEFIGLDEEEAFDDPHELSEEDMDRLKFYPDFYDDRENCRTFREELQRLIDNGEKFPIFFASTEY